MQLVDLGDPILHNVTEWVTVNEKTVKEALDLGDYLASLGEDEALGIAAPQIGIARAYCVLYTPTGIVTMFNPVIQNRRGPLLDLPEACLSIPGRVFHVKRYSLVRVRFRDLKGQEEVRSFAGLTARVVQHEVDHLQGTLIMEKG